MNIVVAFSFIDENAQMVENKNGNAIIVSIDKTDITEEDQFSFKLDLERFLRGLHDPRRQLSHKLFNSYKKALSHVVLKMSELNGGGALLQAIREHEDHRF